jgi:hypothetical protein
MCSLLAAHCSLLAMCPLLAYRICSTLQLSWQHGEQHGEDPCCLVQHAVRYAGFQFLLVHQKRQLLSSAPANSSMGSQFWRFPQKKGSVNERERHNHIIFEFVYASGRHVCCWGLACP